MSLLNSNELIRRGFKYLIDKKFFSKGLFFLFLISLISVSLAVSITNPGFEDETRAPWSDFGGSIGFSNLHSEYPHSGQNSYRLYNVRQDSPYNVLTQTVNVEPNTTYRLSGYIRTTLSSGACQIDFYNHPEIDTIGTSHIRGTTGWTRYTETFTTPNITSGQIRLLQVPAVGSCYFDDIQMEEVFQNSAPVLNGIPDIEVNENDGAHYSIIDLYRYASDDEDSLYELDFEVIEQTNSGLIYCSVDDGTYVDCRAPTPNASGSNTITVRVTDTDGAYDTDTFVVRVIEDFEENYAPKINGIPDQEVNENDGAHYSMINLYSYTSDDQDSLSELDFEVVEQTNSGLINCYVDDDRYIDCSAPRLNASGSNTITVRVTDTDGAYDTDTFVVRVIEDFYENDGPNISGIPDLDDGQIEENDGSHTRLLDLYNYARDDEDSDSELDFRVYSQSNTSLINCYIDDDRWFACDAPRDNRTGRSTIVIEVEDTDGETDTDTFVLEVEEEDFSGASCSDIDVDTRTIYMDESKTEGITFDIRNRGEDDFEIFDVDVYESSSYLSVSNIDYPTRIRDNGEEDLEFDLRSSSITSDKEVSVYIDIRGEFEDGRSCSFSDVGRETFRVWIDNEGTSSSSGSCNDIDIKSSDVTIPENSKRTKIITIENDNSNRFYVDTVSAIENSPYFNVEVRVRPSSISSRGDAEIDLRIETQSVSRDRTDDVEIKVSGHFSNGTYCSSSSIKERFDITVDNRTPSDDDDSDEDDVPSGAVEVDFSNSFATLEEGQSKIINVAIRNGLDRRECFSLSSNDTPIFSSRVSSSNVCISENGSESVTLTITAKNPGTDNVQFNVDYDGISKRKYVTVEVLGDSSPPLERPRVSVFNDEDEIVRDRVIVLENNGQDLRNVSVRVLNLPDGIEVESISISRWVSGETIELEVGLEPGFEGVVETTLSINSDSGSIGVPVEFEVASGADLTGFVSLATTAGMAIGLIILVILAILGVLSIFSKK